MFESNMLENMQSIQDNATWSNPWRELVSLEFKVFLNSMSTSKQDTAEEETEL